MGIPSEYKLTTSHMHTNLAILLLRSLGYAELRIQLNGYYKYKESLKADILRE